MNNVEKETAKPKDEINLILNQLKKSRFFTCFRIDGSHPPE